MTEGFDGRNAAAFDARSEDIFDRISSRYDLLCDIFSLFIHRSWKSKMAKRIAALDAAVILDVASGTGDIPLRVLNSCPKRRPLPNTGRFLVTDICPGMLSVAERKLVKHIESVEIRVLDAHDLREIESGSVDVFSISFGMKICRRDLVLAEALRVLKPGGQFFCLEASRLNWRPLHWAYLSYMSVCLPLMSWLAHRRSRATYMYFLKGITNFPGQKAYAEEIRDLGFEMVRFENFSLGIVALHSAKKPSGR